MPTAWIPLDLQLTRKAEEGINVITRDQLRSLNSKNESMVLSEQQIETFLEVQHSIGKLLYFNVKHLRDYVIISPVYLVEVLTSLVTAKQFWPKRECFPRILKTLQTTGFIDKEDIYYLWTQEEFRHILEYKDYMVDLNLQMIALALAKVTLLTRLAFTGTLHKSLSRKEGNTEGPAHELTILEMSALSQRKCADMVFLQPESMTRGNFCWSMWGKIYPHMRQQKETCRVILISLSLGEIYVVLMQQAHKVDWANL
ncbi:unnamed protein product [Mytilus coruscus]|uniref:COR domain-containing protein n=1 Tax=Mytilus coruscus TaxID=42192 RepID=A0A6J8ERM6_MYTCO|nr:unnamed protein product [Mytilus coruscus]